MDDIDRAADYQEKELAYRLAGMRENVSDKKQSLFECEDCGEPIPEARRLAVPGCTRCVSCQDALEKKK